MHMSLFGLCDDDDNDEDDDDDTTEKEYEEENNDEEKTDTEIKLVTFQIGGNVLKLLFKRFVIKYITLLRYTRNHARKCLGTVQHSFHTINRTFRWMGNLLDVRSSGT